MLLDLMEHNLKRGKQKGNKQMNMTISDSCERHERKIKRPCKCGEDECFTRVVVDDMMMGWIFLDEARTDRYKGT